MQSYERHEARYCPVCKEFTKTVYSGYTLLRREPCSCEIIEAAKEYVAEADAEYSDE